MGNHPEQGPSCPLNSHSLMKKDHYFSRDLFHQHFPGDYFLMVVSLTSSVMFSDLSVWDVHITNNGGRSLGIPLFYSHQKITHMGGIELDANQW